jgi:hypothetical protein
MISPLARMHKLYEETRCNRVKYRKLRLRGDQDAGIDAMACAIREQAILECMMIMGLPKAEAIKLAEYKP